MCSSDLDTYFKLRGYSKAARAAIIVNLQSESSLDLNAFNSAEGGCGAYGLAQWRGPRQTNLYNYAKSIGKEVDTFEAQIGFLYRELETGEMGTAITSFRISTNPSDASFLFSSKFERFTDSDNPNNPEVKKRQRLAEQIFKTLV